MLEKTFYSLSEFFSRRSGYYRTPNVIHYNEYLIDQPAWLVMSNVHDYRRAVAENPVLYGCIDILASAASNGKKYLVDLNGKEVPWTSGKTGVKQARKLFVDRPNPLQSVKEFSYERAYMYFTFGNNYVYLNNPLKTFDTDLITIQTMYNLPSEWMVVKQTGMIYDQVDLKGIIAMYCLTNYNPVKEFTPDKIIHFNDINISNIGNSIVGSSRLETLKMPITNTQLAFEAMNVILKSRGMQGIIKANNKDATGTQIPMNPQAKKEIDEIFKVKYGIQRDQNQFLISYSDIDYIKTIMNSKELGIYEEFSNNAMIISNGLKVPTELYKTYIQGATFENQIQAVRRLYQDNIIPHTENDDLYWTERLGMRNYGLELKTDWSHIAALQEAFKEKAQAMFFTSRASDMAYNANIITWNDYLRAMDLDPVQDGNRYKWERTEIPVVDLAPVAPVKEPPQI
jgi:phage portal protein BeeE